MWVCAYTLERATPKPSSLLRAASFSSPTFCAQVRLRVLVVGHNWQPLLGVTQGQIPLLEVQSTQGSERWLGFRLCICLRLVSICRRRCVPTLLLSGGVGGLPQALQQQVLGGVHTYGKIRELCSWYICIYVGAGILRCARRHALCLQFARFPRYFETRHIWRAELVRYM